MTTKRYELLQDSAGYGQIYKAGIVLYPSGNCYIHEKTGAYFLRHVVENNPAWFREVVEKDWEVVALIGNHTELIYNLDDKKGLFFANNKALLPIDLSKGMKEAGCDILSVKRKSDQEIFSVGDEVDFRNGGAEDWNQYWSGKIESFEINKDDKIIVVIKEAVDYTSKKYLCNVRKKLTTPTKQFEWNDTDWNGIVKNIKGFPDEECAKYLFNQMNIILASKQNTNEEIKFEFPKLRREDVVCPPQEMKVNYFAEKSEKKYTIEDLEKAFHSNFASFEGYKKTLEK